ncbi:unnamed protein product [Adineta steineri]|uniref:Uncharacterized protein n=2 Tax=Adineta steineri TaxID=433720 RepID=A0A819GDR1_9BILA|nr:unnamed protein product [Adineta steineri]
MVNSGVTFFVFFVVNTLLVSNSQQQQTRGLIPPELLTDNSLYHVVPQGAILLWSGAAHLVPQGWAVCDGTQGTPDLRDRFVIGSGPNAQFSVGQKGGASSATPTLNIRPTRLTVAQMPEHSHGGLTSIEDTSFMCYNQDLVEGITTSHNNITNRHIRSDRSTMINTESNNKTVNCHHQHTIEKQGNNEPHSHEVTTDALKILPPFHALVYIMKL